MSYRATPSFSVGGVSWLGSEGHEALLSNSVPTGWRCFHCNEHFWHWRAAMRHFGEPGKIERPICVEEKKDDLHSS